MPRPSSPKPIVEKIEGWTIELDPALKTSEQSKLLGDVRKAMANHLQRIVFILPPEKTEALRKLPIRIDIEHKLTNMQYHPSKQWLTANGHDPSLENAFTSRERAVFSPGAPGPSTPTPFCMSLPMPITIKSSASTTRKY